MLRCVVVCECSSIFENKADAFYFLKIRRNPYEILKIRWNAHEFLKIKRNACEF